MNDVELSGLIRDTRVNLRRLHSTYAFLNTLADNGGAYGIEWVKNHLCVDEDVINFLVSEDKLLAIEVSGITLYPAFQFSEERGIIFGLSELLPLLDGFSDRMKYSFFIEDVGSRFGGTSLVTRVADMLNTHPDTLVMGELKVLARNYGTQNPV